MGSRIACEFVSRARMPTYAGLLRELSHVVSNNDTHKGSASIFGSQVAQSLMRITKLLGVRHEHCHRQA